MSIVFYVIGAIIRVVMSILTIPMAALGAIFSLPVLDYVWGAWVWFCALWGDAGDILLATSRGAITAAGLYLPLFIVRRLSLRKTPTVPKVA